MAEEPMNNRDPEIFRAKLRTYQAVLNQLGEKSKPDYSSEVIQRYREMRGRQAFRRQIEGRVPGGLNTDDVTLSCGHKLETMASLINATDGRLHCRECEREWLAKAVEEEKKDRNEGTR